ncbi:MAG: MltA domain-containing protein [Rhodospirillaceae bacterium]|nr:MltA domain-containing protein [Rhodospirillales bacterium]
MRRLALIMLALVSACAPATVRPPAPWVAPAPAPSTAGPERLDLRPGSFSDLPGWRDDTLGAALPALVRTCDRLTKRPFDESIGLDGAGGTVGDWHSPCSAARRLSVNDHETARAFFEAWFTPFLATNNGTPDGLFTGYFEPELAGSRTRTNRFTVPLLGKPRDLIVRDGTNGESQVGRMVAGRFEAYPARAEIEAGALANVAQPVAWVEDPVDAHILHIQGSGRIRLDDGSVLRLGVAGTNGHKFVGISRIMREKGLIEDTSMPAVRSWLKSRPDQARTLMAQNPRYIFYRSITGDGPLGSEGVALTPERSMAVDRKFVPLGVPLFLDTVEPSGKPLRRVVMAQDTGAAIKGPVRGDFFWGSGEPAFQQAGRMKSPGRYWLLLPKSRSPRIASVE